MNDTPNQVSGESKNNFTYFTYFTNGHTESLKCSVIKALF